jgi:NAD(P)-dependent dehydrogenase (short-subunit alcohol dehydrogenase family)
MGSMTGRRAIVTGGASGIGRATAELLAAEGARVAVADLDEAGARAVAEACGPDALGIGVDVAVAEECRRAVERAAEAFGGLDVLVNNAGIIRRADVVETTEEEWDRVMAVNVRSVYLMSRFAIPAMVAGGGGAIVNTGSGWGLKGGARAASYCASKAAVVNLTRAMAIDHGPQDVRVNCVCPGDTDTAMLRSEAEQLGEPKDVFLADAASRPLRRIGTPQDIAHAIVYLASDAAGFVTGSVLVVDGGGLA